MARLARPHPARSGEGAPVESARESTNSALIRAIPRTGRTHQIRVHLSSIGHPIVGDKIYGPDEQLYLRFIETGWTHELEQQTPPATTCFALGETRNRRRARMDQPVPSRSCGIL